MIDKKKLIEAIDNRVDRTGHVFIDIEVMVKMIKDIPEEDGWIPCDERTPKTPNIDVEVTTEDKERTIGYYAGELWFESITECAIDVVAWKEPSEPWEGE